MKKLLIALAAAGLLSAPAPAFAGGGHHGGGHHGGGHHGGGHHGGHHWGHGHHGHHHGGWRHRGYGYGYGLRFAPAYYDDCEWTRTRFGWRKFCG